MKTLVAGAGTAHRSAATSAAAEAAGTPRSGRPGRGATTRGRRWTAVLRAVPAICATAALVVVTGEAALADASAPSPDPVVTTAPAPTPSATTPRTNPPLVSPEQSPDTVTMPTGDYGGKAPSTPIISVTCTKIYAAIPDLARTGGMLGVGWGPASAGTPAITVYAQTYNPAVDLAFDPAHLPYNGTAMRWRVVAYNDLGYATFETSGTTTPCPAPPFARPQAPTRLTTCGSTMDDVAPIPDPGVWYTHDAWNLYAHLRPGWQWDLKALSTVWFPVNSDPTLFYIPRQELFALPSRCLAYELARPPASALPNGAGWTGAAGSGGTRAAGTATAAEPAAGVLASQPAPGTAVTSAVAPATPPAPTTGTDPTPTATPRTTAAPRPSPTPSIQAQPPRVATTTGLGVAGGLTGACVLAAAGAFVVRLRRLPTLGETPAYDAHPGTL